MKALIFLVKLLSIFLIFILIYTPSWGQSNSSNKNIFGLSQSQLSGFSNDDRIKLLLLNLLPSGITETAAKEIAKALQLNLYNTNHFTVVGTSEWIPQIKDRDPTLADCHDIACGIMIGKMFHADKVLVGTIHSETILNENGKEDPSIIDEMLEKYEAVDVMLKAGDVAFFGPYVFHSSSLNKTDSPRRVLINGYAQPGANKREYPGVGLGRHLKLNS